MRWIFPLFLAITHLFYFPTWNAGFVTDFTGLQWRLEAASFWGFLNCFGFPALEQVLNIFLFVFYKLFHIHGLPWYLIFTTLHSLNGWMLYRVTHRLLHRVDYAHAGFAAFTGALLFLICPYHTEVVVWRVCFNFLFVGFQILWILWLTIRWIETSNLRYVWAIVALTFSALFTFELALTLPLICLGLGLALSADLRSILRYNVPQWVLVFLYFVLNKLILGAWVGHYGENIHLRFPLQEMAGNLGKFTLKLCLLARYWPENIKATLFKTLGNDMAEWMLLAFLLLVVAWIIRRWKRWTPLQKLAIFLAGAYIITLGPVLNLYFYFIRHIALDRYVYVPSMFLFALVAIAISKLPRNYRAGITILIVFIFSTLLVKTNSWWHHSTRIYYGLVNDFRWHDRPAVYVLALPENLQGAPMFLDYSDADNGFPDALQYTGGKAYTGKMMEVTQFDLKRPHDKVERTLPDSTGAIFFRFSQKGNSWLKQSFGAQDYEKPDFKWRNLGEAYELIFKDTVPGAVWIVPEGDRWQEVEIK